MYVVIQYGSEERLLNPNCRCLMLLDALKRRIQASGDVELDVSDEQGNVKLLRENLDRYAAELFTDRERLVLVKVDRKESGECDYLPLIDNQNIVTESFMAQLSSRLNLTAPSKNTRHRPANGQQVGNKRTNAASKTTNTSTQRSLVTPEPRQTATFSASATGNAASSVSAVLGRQMSASSTGSGDGRPDRVSVGGSNNKNKSTKNK